MNNFIGIYSYSLVAISLIIIGLTIYKIWCSHSAKNWKTVPAKILELKILVKDFLVFKVYMPRVKYSVLDKGKTVYKHKLTITNLSFYKKDTINAIYAQHQVLEGRETVAYQNQIFKSSYILVPGLERGTLLIVPLLLSMFAVGNLMYQTRIFEGFSKPYIAIDLYHQSYDLMEKGQHAQAYTILKKSQSLDSTIIESYYLELELASHLPNAKQIKLNCYDKILAIDPSKANIRYNRGLLFYENQQYDLAIKDFKEYLKQEKDADGAYNLAFCYLNLGIKDSAKMVLQNPEYINNSDCRKLLGTIE